MDRDAPPRKMLSAEAARFLTLSKQGLHQAVLAGRLRAERIGSERVLVFRRADLERYRMERERRRAEHAEQKGRKVEVVVK